MDKCATGSLESPVGKEVSATAKTKPVKEAGTAGQPGVTLEQRSNYIEVAAYYVAERYGAYGGDPMVVWAVAEAEIDRLLAEGRLNQPPSAFRSRMC